MKLPKIFEIKDTGEKLEPGKLAIAGMMISAIVIALIIYIKKGYHKDILKKVWASNHNKLDNFLYADKLDKESFIPLVVLSNPKSLLNIRYAPKEIKSHILRGDQLVSYIQKGIENTDKMYLLNEKTLKKIAETWLERSIQNNYSEEFILLVRSGLLL